MKNLTQISKRRAIISGDIIELYEYQWPYAYNQTPQRSRSGAPEVSSGVPAERREDNLGFVRAQIRRLIECNVTTYGYPPVFLTFTFRDNVTDVSIANSYFHDFIKRFTRRAGKNLKYLAIIEFQKRGAVHYHCVFFNLGLDWERRERTDRVIAGLWGHGFVDIERIRHAKRVAPYVCKYLNKGLHDPRLRGRKSYFTSRALLRPVQLRRESSIDDLFRDANIEEVKVERYSSIKRGEVKYTQYVRRNN